MPARFAPTQRPARPRPEPEATPARVWLFVVVVAAMASTTSATTFDLERLESPHRLSWIVLAVLFYLTESNVVHLHVRREAHSFSLSEVPLVLGLFFVGPGELIGAQALGSAVALFLHRRQRGPKLTFNLAQFALSTSIAALVFHRAVGAGGELSPEDLVAALGATLASAAVGLVATQLAIAVSQGARSGDEHLVQVVAFGVVTALANASLGMVAVSVMWDRPAGYVLLVVPAATMLLAYRAYLSERQKREGIEGLYASTRLLQGSTELHRAVQALLVHVCAMFRAESAEMVLFPGGDGSRALGTALRAGQPAEPLRSVALDPSDLVLASVAADRGGVLVRRRDRHVPLGGLLADTHFKDAMVVSVQGDHGPIGVLRVANRLGDVGTFDEHDLCLLETLANHAGVSLENGHLAEALSELREHKAELEQRALFDPLTNLANRHLFSERLQEALADRRQQPPALLFLDLDGFKGVNDRLGHAAGDRVLLAVASRIRDCLRPGDTPARLGGDEFAVLLPDAGNAENATRVANRIVEALRTPIDAGERNVVVGASIGVAVATCPEIGPDALIEQGDIAMYAAKARIKGSVAVFEPGLGSKPQTAA